MINGKELRIGNWVKDSKGSGDLDQVESITRDGINHWCNNWENVQYSGETPFKDLDPIILTPEIFEKCGFIKHSDSAANGWMIQTKYGSQVNIFIPSDEGSVIKFWPNGIDKESFWVPINFVYLHRLQNFYFELTDEELVFTP